MTTNPKSHGAKNPNEITTHAYFLLRAAKNQSTYYP